MQKIFDIFSLSRGIVIYLFNFAISGNDILNLLRKPSKMNNSVQMFGSDFVNIFIIFNLFFCSTE